MENYKALFDEWSDDPLGIDNYGKTRSLEEMVVLPRREISRSEVQTVAITGSPTGGTWTAEFNGETTASMPWNVSAANFKDYLESLPSIGVGDVEVLGGPSKLLLATNRPTEPPDGDRIAVFTPMTLPSMLNSGPPELPLLMDASVWR